ncbi:MAG TPA: hypothetical protein VGG25_02130 [Streptosporangiaceae bacterium]|jgi:hypothetical protein
MSTTASAPAGRPEPPPWGVLLASRLATAGLSARRAARQAGISEGRWRQIASGYQVVSPGVYAPVRGPAGTVAAMAAVAGLTPAQLRAAGRDDAARLLAARDASDRGDLLDRIRALSGDQARDLLAQIVSTLSGQSPDPGNGDGPGDPSA